MVHFQSLNRCPFTGKLRMFQFKQSASLFKVITARKRSLRRLCFHRCLSVHRGACVAGGHVWWGCVWWLGVCMMGGMHDRGCMWQGGHPWQGACMVVGDVCGEGHAWWGHVWWGACMAGGVRGRRGACMAGVCVCDST